MRRFLFVVPPFVGHVNPTLAVGAMLLSRGHRVGWSGHASVLAPLLPAGAELFPADDARSAERLNALHARSHGLRGAEAFRFLWKDVIVPFGDAMLPAVEAAVERFAPDVIVADQQAIAGAAVGRRRRMRWATSATTSSELVGSSTIFPLFERWIAEELRAFERRVGVSTGRTWGGDLRFSEHLVLAFSTHELVGSGPFPATWRFVGPAFGSRAVRAGFPWSWLDPQRRHVLVTLGTVNAASGGRFLRVAAEAAARLETQLQAIIVAPPGIVEAPASNVLVCKRVPQVDLLAQVDAVVCHAGHNTVCEALAHGIPLVVAPIRDDQPIIAQQVVDAGAGVRVKYGRAGPDEIASALETVLEDDRYRRAAARIQRSFLAAGGPAAACDALESL